MGGNKRCFFVKLDTLPAIINNTNPAFRPPHGHYNGNITSESITQVAHLQDILSFIDLLIKDKRY